MQLTDAAAEELSMNQDFTVMTDWDCPLSTFKGGLTAAKHVGSCRHKQLALHSLRVTMIAPRLLLFCAQENSVATLSGKVDDYCAHVDGFLVQKEQLGELCELSKSGWGMSQSAFKATLQALQAQQAGDAEVASTW
jgi:hypothetical protein